MAQLETMMRQHFIDYASYFILDRAIPDLCDGLKPVQRRILHTLFRMNDGRFHKVAGIIGETMKLHPHGDVSIADALVVLANKGFFIDTQGNFGNLLTGHPAAAARYIECRLSPLALETLFNDHLTEQIPSYDGRNMEPVRLPAKLPVVLMLGIEGIAVGMATKILPHNLKELWDAQIAVLNKKKFELLPDFPQGGQMDVAAYDDGRGKVEVRARIETVDPKRVRITELPWGKTTEGLIASIESAVQKGRVKVASIDDFTTDRVEIELTLARGARPREVIPQLYAYSDCSVSVSSNINVIDNRKPVQLCVTEILQALTRQLVEQLKAELEWERDRLVDRQHWLSLEQVFIEKGVYKKLEKAETAEKVSKVVFQGMKPFAKLFIREMVDDDVKRLLELRIRRISAYDIERNRSEIDEVIAQIAEVDKKLANMKRTTTLYLKSLLKRYGDQFPRRTEITRIESVDKKDVALQNLKLSYDPDSGYFGLAVRGDLFRMSLSEYDLVLAIAADGTYRVMPPVDKQFFGAKLIYCHPFDPEQGVEFTVVYRDAKRMAYGKRIRIEKFIRNKEYRLVKDEKGRVDLLLQEGETGTVKLAFVAKKRQRVKAAEYDLAQLEETSAGARGTRLAAKPVARLSFKPVARKKARAQSKSESKAGRSRGRRQVEEGALEEARRRRAGRQRAGRALLNGMIQGIVPGQDHREARARLEDAGWGWIARGDWSQVYASPDGHLVARVAPFDPAYALHVSTCLAHPEVRAFQRIDWRCPLAPAGELVVMERLGPADPDRARELCCILGETGCLDLEPDDRARLAFAEARLGDPALRRLFELLRATAREGARRIGWFGGLDVRPGNVLADEVGRLVLIDPYFVAGPRLIPAILGDVEAVGRHYGPEELRGFLEIAAFEEERDAPGPVLAKLRERVAFLESRDREAS